MFVKCANGGCSSLFRYSLGAMVFEVREDAEEENAPAVHHWFCPECLPIILRAWFDHGNGRQAKGRQGRRVRLVSLESVGARRVTKVEQTRDGVWQAS
jgi:hypothetical protein